MKGSLTYVEHVGLDISPGSCNKKPFYLASDELP